MNRIIVKCWQANSKMHMDVQKSKNSQCILEEGQGGTSCFEILRHIIKYIKTVWHWHQDGQINQ